MKKFFESLRNKKIYIRYSIITLLNILFFSLMSVPFFRNEKAGDFWQFVIIFALFAFSLIYGFLCVEITNNYIIGNLIMVIFGGLWVAFTAYSIIPTEHGNILYSLYYFLRYGIVSFFVGLVVKNTRNY